MQLLFVILQAILLFIFLVKDTVNLAPYNNRPAELKYLGWTQILLSTAITAGGTAFCLYSTIQAGAGGFLDENARLFSVVWWGLALVSMYKIWYKPYLFGPRERDLDNYRKLFSNTHTTLPVRKEFPGPNTLHLIMHFFLVACAALGWMKAMGKF